MRELPPGAFVRQPGLRDACWLLWLRLTRRTDRRDVSLICPRCAYPVLGLSTARCPECGEDFATRGVLGPSVPRRFWAWLAILALWITLVAVVAHPAAAWMSVHAVHIRGHRYMHELHYSHSGDQHPNRPAIYIRSLSAPLYHEWGPRQRGWYRVEPFTSATVASYEIAVYPHSYPHRADWLPNDDLVLELRLHDLHYRQVPPDLRQRSNIAFSKEPIDATMLKDWLEQPGLPTTADHWARFVPHLTEALHEWRGNHFSRSTFWKPHAWQGQRGIRIGLRDGRPMWWNDWLGLGTLTSIAAIWLVVAAAVTRWIWRRRPT